jgi:SPP1 family predicted phage head-tail adaptor
MRMDEQVTLRSTTTGADGNGAATTTNVDTVVFAEKQSVKRQEYYASQAAGIKADVVFVVNADDYTDQMTVLYGATVYKVTRAYQIGRGRVELTCAKR